MKTATLAQGNQVLNLILQKKMPAEHLQKILESGLLSDLLDGNIDEVNRAEFRRVLGFGDLIDLDANPFVPYGWEVRSHQKGGQFTWSPDKVRLHLSSSQRGKGRIDGDDLQKELEKERVMNANLLDYLLKNPDIIPESWKKDDEGNMLLSFFWGTIYCGPANANHRCVRYLCFRGDAWSWGQAYLIDDWCFNRPAVLAS